MTPRLHWLGRAHSTSRFSASATFLYEQWVQVLRRGRRKNHRARLTFVVGRAFFVSAG
jgi:hypothetical protein